MLGQPDDDHLRPHLDRGRDARRSRRTAIDGAVAGGGGTDRFRIKLWDVGTGTVVYDNQIGSSTIRTRRPHSAAGAS